MGWDKGKYYSRSRRVGGRVAREYVGGGAAGELAARADAARRERRRLDALASRLEREDLASLDAAMKALAETTELVARAALLAAGYRRHNRGEWRRRREQGR